MFSLQRHLWECVSWKRWMHSKKDHGHSWSIDAIRVWQGSPTKAISLVWWIWNWCCQRNGYSSIVKINESLVLLHRYTCCILLHASCTISKVSSLRKKNTVTNDCHSKSGLSLFGAWQCWWGCTFEGIWASRFEGYVNQYILGEFRELHVWPHLWQAVGLVRNLLHCPILCLQHLRQVQPQGKCWDERGPDRFTRKGEFENPLACWKHLGQCSYRDKLALLHLGKLNKS